MWLGGGGGGLVDKEKKDIFCLFVIFGDEKPAICGGYFPLVNEDCCCLFRTTSNGARQYLTFSYEEYLEPGQVPRTPWILWHRDNEKIEEKTLKGLIFQDYDVKSLSSDAPTIRGSFPPGGF